MKLFRPLGPVELRLIEQSQWKKFPPRLPDQPIFYPVCNFAYAEKISREWNLPRDKEAYVVSFDVNDEYMAQFQRQIVGSKEHEEYWIPAEQLEEFNANIVGDIVVALRLVIPFKTTEEQLAMIPKIGQAMLEAGLTNDFVDMVTQLAGFDQGVFDLLEMWQCEIVERSEIVSELFKSIADYRRVDTVYVV
jgi:hypothetical protein